jgi:hypothetical protein
MRVRSFFSVKTEEKIGTMNVQGSFKLVFDKFFHCGARGYSKVYAKIALAH